MTAEIGQRIVYFIPHQDDELLTMGIDIALSVEKGFDVFAVLCTDGSRSRIREILNNNSFCNKCNSVHNFSLSVNEFVAARDREFMSSCSSLGIKKENIIIASERITDGNLTVENAKKLIIKYLELLGEDSRVCTVYPNDPSLQHKDHRRLGLAAVELKNEGVIKHLELMEEPYVASNLPDERENPPEKIKADKSISAKVRSAVAQYSLFSPADGRFAIGYHSVTREMELLKEEMTLYRHVYR